MQLGAQMESATTAAWSPQPANATLQSSSSWVSRIVVLAPLVSVTLLSKFAVPPFGADGIDLSLPIIALVVALGMMGGRIRFDSLRLAAYAFLIGLLGLMQILQPGPLSTTSMLLFAVLHFPYVLNVLPIAGEAEQGKRILGFFLTLSICIAWLGIAQYFLQFVVPARWLFPIENFVPTSFSVQGFNKQAILSYGSHVYRANGLFMLEPSFFSQLLAVAVVAELCTFHRIWRLAVYALALVVSYSGTGLMVLAICVPVFIITHRRWDVLLLMALALALVVPFADSLHLDRLLNRVGEFDSTRTSGFARFVGGFYMFRQFLWNDPLSTLFGLGAGAFNIYISRAHYPAAEMALFKLVLEFGIVGTCLYFGFLFVCLMNAPVPRLITLAIAITYLLNGIYTPFAHGLALTLLVWGSPLVALRGASQDPLKNQSASKTHDMSGAGNVSADASSAGNRVSVLNVSENLR